MVGKKRAGLPRFWTANVSSLPAFTAVSHAQTHKTRIRRAIERLGPYASLCLLAVPAAIVEPLKLVAVVVAGSGHWMAGTVTILCAYALSLLLIERLFLVVKPKLLTLRWFAALWNWFVTARGAVLGWLGFNRLRQRLAKQPAAFKSQVARR